MVCNEIENILIHMCYYTLFLVIPSPCPPLHLLSLHPTLLCTLTSLHPAPSHLLHHRIWVTSSWTMSRTFL